MLGGIDTFTVAHDWAIRRTNGWIGMVEYRNVSHEEGLNHIVVYAGTLGDFDLRYPARLPLWPLLTLAAVALIMMPLVRRWHRGRVR